MCLRDIRFGWSLIKEFNSYLTDTLNIVKVAPVPSIDKNSKWLSTGIYISSLRDLIMLPIKSELKKNVMQKTSLPREGAPKITVTR